MASQRLQKPTKEMEEPPRNPIVRMRQTVIDTNDDDSYRATATYDLFASKDMLEADRPLYGQRQVFIPSIAGLGGLESAVWTAIGEREGFALAETRPVERERKAR